MADDSLELGYFDILDDIVVGARRTHPRWFEWFEATPAQGHFDTRIRKVFDERGHVPSLAQFFKAKESMQDKNDEENTDEDEA